MVKTLDLQARTKELSKEYDLTHYELLQRFMFERILERISVSKYCNNFILKGGLLLSAMFGIDNRTTKDMDTTIVGIDISKEKMVNVLNDILSIDLKDNVKFCVVDITDIRNEDEYGGNKYHVVGKLENLSVNLEIDISTGDKVTPKELKFKYPLLFEDRTILISSYNIETILSEKLETVLRRGKFNSRMKDYYDIYYFLTRFKDNINHEIMKNAMNNTFTKRGSQDYLKDYKEIIDSIVESNRMEELWLIYSKKNKYAMDIRFISILKLLKKFIEDL